MIVKVYDDDGYHNVDVSMISDNYDEFLLIEILFDKGLLTVEEATSLLPIGFEVEEVSFM